MRNRALVWIALVLAVVAISCSTGPTPPKPGTPAFYWGAAQEAYRAGDYPNTSKNLSELIRGDSEFAAKARAWHVVVSSGLAHGFSEMADSYEAGGRANRENSMPFHKQVTALRSLASAAALEFAESAHVLVVKDKDPNVLLAFAYPSGSLAEPAALRKVAAGMLIQDSERDAMQTAMLQRGVLRSLCMTVGSPDDPAKALEMFKATEVRAPREVFLLGVAKLLEERSNLFGFRKMDQPSRLKVLDDEAIEALQGVPASNETKALITKIQDALKKIKTSI